ncbi:MAG: TatD family hydrolase [Saccharofermentanales bacterium]
MLFDTHAHLNDEKFGGDYEAMLERAAAAGVSKILIAAYDEESSLSALQLACAGDGLYCSLGVHPHDAKDYTATTGETFRQLAAENKDKVVAIGEIGLDYHYDLSPRELQRAAFEAQIRIASACDLPFIIHDREAHGDIMTLIESCHKEGILRQVPGVFHCYSGSVEMAHRILALGFYISFAGPLTFKNARRAAEVMAMVPKDRILIETDSPYLSPEPFRGRRNEPANVQFIAAKMAEITGISAKEAGEITFDNACRLFGIR